MRSVGSQQRAKLKAEHRRRETIRAEMPPENSLPIWPHKVEGERLVRQIERCVEQLRVENPHGNQELFVRMRPQERRTTPCAKKSSSQISRTARCRHGPAAACARIDNRVRSLKSLLPDVASYRSAQPLYVRILSMFRTILPGGRGCRTRR